MYTASNLLVVPTGGENMYLRFDAQGVCDVIFRVGFVDVACNVQDVGDGEFSFSDLTWCRSDINARNLKNLLAVGMIRHEGDEIKSGIFEIVESPLWDVIEGLKTACGQHDRREYVGFVDEPELTQAEWLRVRDWFLGGGRQMMSSGSLLVYMLEAMSGNLLSKRLIPIQHHVPADQRRYWVSVNPLYHLELMWEGMEMIYPIGHEQTYYLDCPWRLQPSPFWPAMASLKDAILQQ